mmetsp:Transcript_11276/g.21345  ORF Transcript_11276/g.21345 Transcript_11276/m.21345 type:complete len:290 (+) Transcript_11276:249-1118(+)
MASKSSASSAGGAKSKKSKLDASPNVIQICDVGDSEDWTSAEQTALEQMLVTHPDTGKLQSVHRYIAISRGLAAAGVSKPLRSIVLRVRWTRERDGGRKRKPEDAGTKKAARPPRSEREPRGQSIFSMGMWPPPNGHPPSGATGAADANPQASAAPAMPMSVGGLHAAPSPGGMAGPGMPLNGSLNTAQYAASIPHLEDHGADSIGNLSGQTAQLLEQNLEVISQVRNHWAAHRVHENGPHLSQMRDNLLQVLNCMASMPGVMAQMPPLPVQLNIELASHILPLAPTAT